MWLCTAFGAGLLYLRRDISARGFDFMLGAAAGIMIAASFWSLLNPAISLLERSGQQPALVIAGGFLSGAFLILAINNLLPHVHIAGPAQRHGLAATLPRSVLLALAMTLHNFPEGLAVGVGFGAASQTAISFEKAAALAVGIGLQNIPEGFAVAIALYRDGVSRHRSFMYGQSSGLIEVLAAVVGAIFVLAVQSILPFALSFAAGAMVFVVLEDIIPECQTNGNSQVAAVGGVLGFAVMMVLDISFHL